MEADFGFNIRRVSWPGCGAALNSSACGGVMRRPHIFLKRSGQRWRRGETDAALSREREGRRREKKCRCETFVSEVMNYSFLNSLVLRQM